MEPLRWRVTTLGLLDVFKEARRALFAKDTAAGTTPQTEASVWATSPLYKARDFPQYNPDQLIGRKGHGIYAKMMLDEQVKAAVNFKRGAITSRDYYFKMPEGHDLSNDEADKRIKVFEAIINNMDGSFTDALNGVMSAMFNGFSATEKVYRQFQFNGLTWWGIKQLLLKPYDTFVFRVDEYDQLIEIVQKIDGREQVVDRANIIHFVVNPDVDRYYGGSELRAAYRPWFNKDMAIKFHNIWLERHASGFRWAEIGMDSGITRNSLEYAQLQNVLQQTQVGGSMIVPKGVTLNYSFPNNNVAFKEAIISDNQAIAKALLVPNLLGISEQGDTGSYAQSENQLDAFLWTLDADGNRLADTLNEQLFRTLGDANFGDGVYPLFYFKPMHDRALTRIVSTWKDLVTAGAVKRSDSDEGHLRDLLEFPERDDESLDKSTQPPQQNGLPPPAANTEPNAGQDAPIQGDGTQAAGGGPDNSAARDETVSGRAWVDVVAFSKAAARVNFAVIERRSERVIDDGTARTAEVMGAITGEAVDRIRDQDVTMGEGAAEAVPKFKLDSRLVSKLRRVVRGVLSSAWAIGERHSVDELDKAVGKSFVRRKFDAERVKFISEDFFDLKSFSITGNITDSALATIKNVLLQGAKYGKTWEEMRREIYAAFASNGLLSKADIEQALGESLGVENPAARLNTIMRTNVFEAVNEARYSYFTDPGLNGFVEALEYSATLDRRTTQICQHLDGSTYPLDSEIWNGSPSYRPPNHYNCRSILVPVTRLDTWTKSSPPDIEPQQGFG